VATSLPKIAARGRGLNRDPGASDSQLMRRRAWFIYPIVGGVVTLAYLLVSAFNVGPVFNAIGLSSPVMIVIAVRIWKPEQRLPWYLFALGQTLFVFGDVIAYNYQRFFGTELPYPAISDLLYLSVYPCLIIGILLLIHRRNPGRDRSSMIDSLMLTIGVAVLSWVFLIAPYVHGGGLTLTQKLVSIGYPVMDVLLLGVTVRLSVGAGNRAPAFYLMAASVGALFVTDAIYGWLLLHNGYETGGLLDGGWAIFYVLWGAAALHPSMRTLSEPTAEQDVKLTRLRLFLLAGATVGIQIIRIIQLARHERVDEPILIGASVSLFLLVVARMYGLVRRQEQSASREKALRGAGARLVTATSRETIYAAALEAARTLSATQAHIRVLIAPSPEEEFTVVSATMPEAEGESVDIRGLPSWKRERLMAHRWIQVPTADSDIAPQLSLDASAESIFVAPMFLREELRGLLVVTADAALSRSICESLVALTSQVALALESAILTEDLLRRQGEARFSSLIQNSSDVVMVVEPDTSVRYVSPSIQRVLGFEPAELEGRRLADLFHPDDATRVLSFLAAVALEKEGHPGLIEFRMQHEDGSWLFVETLRTNLLHDPNVGGIVLNTRDVSERKTFEEQLSHQAFHDSVTNLANRALFRDRVAHALERQGRDDNQIAVLFMDLDDFKTVNDSLGHAAGDRLLGEVGNRLKDCLRSIDTAARLGGDEFAILLEDGGHDVEAADVAERVLRSLDDPFMLEGKEVFVRASIGIAIGTEEHREAGVEEILRNADVAMYMAKESGKGRYQVFEPAMHTTAIKRLELKADLQRALEHDEFILHFQPIIELGTGRISGVEALIRWEHPERGLVPPLDFIPLAEETGLIVPIGRWALEAACRQARELQREHPSDPPLHMAVNLSVRQLVRQELVSEVAQVLRDTGLDPATLVLEITESVMMADMDLSISQLTKLKALGVRLAVDDFGTGYSSLNYIRRFPVDILKVDKSFVDGVSEGGEASALTAAVVELASILKLQPVAEGIERADQLERLLELKCALGQGFFFAKPLTPENLGAFLEERQSMRAELEGLSRP
jgi:diguanylate cyclase (GGDEF)-like protein/PAS domain S-box-containing protein